MIYELRKLNKTIISLLLALVIFTSASSFVFAKKAKVDMDVMKAGTIVGLGTYDVEIEEYGMDYYVFFEVPKDGKYRFKLSNLESKSGFDLLQSEVSTYEGSRIYFGTPVYEHDYLTTLRRSLGDEFKEDYLRSAKINLERRCTQTLKTTLDLKKGKTYQIRFKGSTLNDKEWYKCTAKLKIKSAQ